MSLNVGILAPGKGWGNFVSYISSFKTISKVRNTNVILITKEFSSAKSYLEDQQFIKFHTDVTSKYTHLPVPWGEGFSDDNKLTT